MAENTLAEALNSAFDGVEEIDVTPAAPAAAADDTPAAPAAAAKPDRDRDDHGRFTPKAPATPQAAAPATPASAITAPTTPAAVAPRTPPTSWKKEHWDAYQQLPVPVADYINEREKQYVDGVTVYRNEAQAAKELRETLAPFEQDFRRAGVSPAQGIARLAEKHREIVNAPPEAKIQIFQKLAHEYGVPLQSVISGQVDPVMQYLNPLQEQVAQLREQQNSWMQQQQNTEQTAMQTEIEQFAAGNEHFETVRADMAGLLQSGLAQDLQSAYAKAVAMNGLAPTATQSSRPSAAAVVSKARAAAISPKSATPAPGSAPSGKKDVRSILEETVDQFLGNARV